MGGSTMFDQIAQAIQEQQRLMEELENENKQLRNQLAALRAGHGLVIAIGNTHFELQDQVVAEAAPEVTASESPQVQTPGDEITSKQTAILTELPEVLAVTGAP